MRSTGFVVLSLMVHVLIVAAIALSPQRILDENKGQEVEVKMGPPAEQPGTPEAQEESATAPKVQAQAPAPTPTPPAPIPAPPKSEEVAKAKPAPTPKPVLKKATPKVAQASAAPIEKKADAPVIPEKSDDSTLKAVAPEKAAQVQPEEKADEKVQLIPVKEAAPASPQTDDQAATAGDEPAAQTEAASQDVAKTGGDPAPIGTVEDITEGGELGKGGSTVAGAVEYTELKQMSGNKAPFYPLAARKEKRQGQVELLYRVTKDGQVADIQIAQSSGSKDLDQEAVKAISKFRYVPGQEGWARHPVTFALKGDTSSLPSRLRTGSND